MRLAFTGTQVGMTAKQLDAMWRIYLGLDPEDVGHGDCIGSDFQFHNKILEHRGIGGVKPGIYIWPSNLESKRAYCDFANVTYEPAPPLERNRTMVDWCLKLIACPKESKEVMRAGTWSTVRWARRQGKVIYVVIPDGTVI